MPHQSQPHRRLLLTAILASAATLAIAQPAAKPYPNKPIKILVGVPPGGSTDAVARLFADWLRESTGQPAVVENRPGANTTVAADAVARSAPDGYTLLLATDALITFPMLTKANFDPYKDFAPIGTLTLNPFVMTVHPSVPANTVKEFVAYAKSQPGKVSYASSGNGGSSHLGVEKFKLLTGAPITHIPYRGAGPALTDAIGGQVEMSLWTPLAVASHIASGKLKALAVTGDRRLAALPQVPTFSEAGLPAFHYQAWQAVFAPAGTPHPIVDQLNAEIQKMLANPKMKERLDKQGVEPFYLEPDKVTSMMRTEGAELSQLIKAANIKMD